MLKVGVVTTVYNGEKTIGDFLSKLDAVVSGMDVQKPVPVYIVNDGSTDASLSIMLNSPAVNLKLFVSNLARNYGHHQAIFCGIGNLDETHDYVAIIDSDLEENPEYLPGLLEKLIESKHDILTTFQRQRLNGPLNRALAGIADRLLKLALGREYIPGICTLRILRKHAALELQKANDFYPVLGVVQGRLRLSTLSVEIQKSYKGQTEYSFRKKIRLFRAILFSASNFLSHLALGIGLMGFLLSVGSLTWFVVYRITNTNPLPGFTTIGLLVTSLGGVIIFLSSVVIFLLIRIFERTNNESRVVVKNKYER